MILNNNKKHHHHHDHLYRYLRDKRFSDISSSEQLEFCLGYLENATPFCKRWKAKGGGIQSEFLKCNCLQILLDVEDTEIVGMAATNAATNVEGANAEGANVAAANAAALVDGDTELVDALTLLQDVEDIETALQDDVDTEEIAAEATDATAAEEATNVAAAETCKAVALYMLWFYTRTSK